MPEIKKIELDERYIKILTDMSKAWEKENITHGYTANTLETLKNSDIFVAEKAGEAVGYLLCRKYVQKEKLATIPQGKNCLEIEDMYVLPKYRSKGIGKKLYNEAVKSYGDKIEYITLYTATKDYKAILNFYIEELGMDFWCASLYKKI